MQAIPEILIETFHYFSWLNPLLDLGQKRMLEENDMYNILPEDQAEIVGEELQRYFSNVIKLCSNVSFVIRAVLQYEGMNVTEVFHF